MSGLGTGGRGNRKHKYRQKRSHRHPFPPPCDPVTVPIFPFTGRLSIVLAPGGIETTDAQSLIHPMEFNKSLCRPRAPRCPELLCALFLRTDLCFSSCSPAILMWVQGPLLQPSGPVVVPQFLCCPSWWWRMPFSMQCTAPGVSIVLASACFLWSLNVHCVLATALLWPLHLACSCFCLFAGPAFSTPGGCGLRGLCQLFRMFFFCTVSTNSDLYFKVWRK
jgi:hypothetical protein